MAGPSKPLLAPLVLAIAILAGEAQAEPITVFAAASTTEVVSALARRFEERGGPAVRANFAASSTLARQILGGAPADVYISADAAWMDHLAARGAIRPASRRDLFGNRLVIAVPSKRRGEFPNPSRGEAFAEALGDGRLAIGDPDHVPAGRYAEAALRHFGLWRGLVDRLAPMGSVREALVLVARAEVPAGIVYETDARVTTAVRIAYRFPREAHPPIVYPAARIEAGEHPRAPAFMAFLVSAEAREVYRRHGFIAVADGD